MKKKLLSMDLSWIEHQSLIVFHWLGSVFFIICINDIDVRPSNFISKFVDDSKLGNLIPQQTKSTGSYKISAWSERWKKKHFNINKYHILGVGKKYIWIRDERSENWKPTMCHRIKHFPNTVKTTLVKLIKCLVLKTFFSFRNESIILLLYISLIRPTLRVR